MNVLELHKKLVETSSVSGTEAAIADFVSEWAEQLRVKVERVGNSVMARFGTGPLFVLNSHLDTVPANANWTRDPWKWENVDGKLFGLGANDAKASVAAMMTTFAWATDQNLPFELLLMLGEGEETLSIGTGNCLRTLQERGETVHSALVGEPTSLESGTGQYGLAILSLEAIGDACHAAHCTRLGKVNPVWDLAKDLANLASIDFAPNSVQATMLEGSSAKNQVGPNAKATLDVRLAPGHTCEQVIGQMPGLKGQIIVKSDRLNSYACPPEAALLKAVPEPHFLSRTMSDQALFQGIPAVKIGPGLTDRSHTPDEFVLESELLAGVKVYQSILTRFGELL